MIWVSRSILAMAFLAASLLWGGGLYLEVGSATANAEAKSLNAILVARVTACADPARSKVTAHAVVRRGDGMVREELRVVPLKTPGLVAVVGPLPSGAFLDLAVTSPEFPSYCPRVLLRTRQQTVEWASVKRFFSQPPTEADLRQLLD